MIITSAHYFKQPPKKIISLVPSLSELLSYLGLDNEVIGITKFCVHPKDWVTAKMRIGGTKSINIDLIKELQPHLVIANKEENVKEQIEELAKDFDVWVTDVNTLDNALLMIINIGELTYKKNEALELVKRIKTNFYQLPIANPQLKACYLIWQNPFMTIGGDTFINDMMKHCGLKNIFETNTRYPEITIEQLLKSSCELILLSSEPFPFKQKHVDELQKMLPGKKLILVDGEMFSWYGNRLLFAYGYFKDLLRLLSDLVTK